jgi:hypothetical protein
MLVNLTFNHADAFVIPQRDNNALPIWHILHAHSLASD